MQWCIPFRYAAFECCFVCERTELYRLLNLFSIDSVLILVLVIEMFV